MGRRNQGAKLRYLAKRSTFYICWTEGGRSRERSTGTADRQEAEDFLASFLRERQRRHGPSDPTAVLVTEILCAYAAEVGPSMTNPARLGYAIDPLVTFWDGLSVADVRPEACRAYARDRGRAPGTVRRELGALRAAINHAFKEGRITRPVPVALPPSPGPRERWLTRHEVARLLNAARGASKARLHLPLFILIALRCGKRKEAILSLRWPQVDFVRGSINWEREDGRITKKRRGGRNPIPDALRPHLVRAYRRSDPMGYVINYAGRPVKDIKRGFGAACARAGLEDVSPHTLRHTCATWIMQSGRSNLWDAAGFLGMTSETLQKTYGHHDPDHQKGAANAFR